MPAVQGTWGANKQIMSSAQAAQAGDLNSIMAGWVDRGAWTYYDRIIQPFTTTGFVNLLQIYSPFSIGMNKPDAITGLNKTKAFTNLPNSGQFNPPRCLVLQRLGIYFEPSMELQDIEMFMANAYFEFKIDDKIFFEGLIEFHPAGMGISGCYKAPVGDKTVWSNGIPTPHATRSFGNYAKYIAPLQNFFFNIYFPTLAPMNPTGVLPGLPLALAGNLNVVVIMDGLTDRSVQ